MRYADCHPNVKHFCKGLCNRCYRAKWRIEHPDYFKNWDKQHPEQGPKVRTARYRARFPKEQLRKRDRELYAVNRIHVLSRKKAARQRNPEHYREVERRKVARNPELYLGFGRSWRKRNPDKARRACIDWQKRNPARVCDLSHRRRARLAAATTEDCSERIKLLSRKRICHWCGCGLTKENRRIDHVLALARGGKHCPDNLVACCAFCNMSKKDRIVGVEWICRRAA